MVPRNNVSGFPGLLTPLEPQFRFGDKSVKF